MLGITAEARQRFEELVGTPPRAFADELRAHGADRARELLSKLPNLGALLDAKSGAPVSYVFSTHADSLRDETRGYGVAGRPEDYLDAFARYVRENMNKLPALIAVTQRPRELTRTQLRELRALLDEAQFRETWLQTAWRDQSNADIAATIIGFVRQAALGDALIPYEQRVDRAMQKLLGSRKWTGPQRKWLERIGKQLKLQVVVDRSSRILLRSMGPLTSSSISPGPILAWPSAIASPRAART
jgi:type I restriction enzyme R subunit